VATFTIYVRPEDAPVYERIREHAAKLGQPLSAVISSAVRHYLLEHDAQREPPNEITININQSSASRTFRLMGELRAVVYDKNEPGKEGSKIVAHSEEETERGSK
jgi:hypothetical protein